MQSVVFREHYLQLLSHHDIPSRCGVHVKQLDRALMTHGHALRLTQCAWHALKRGLAQRVALTVCYHLGRAAHAARLCASAGPAPLWSFH